MNPIIVKLLIAFAPSIEQLIASLLNHWLKAKKPVSTKAAKKIVLETRNQRGCVSRYFPQRRSCYGSEWTDA